MNASAMVALMVILVVVLVAAFVFAWQRDKKRSDDVSHRTESGLTGDGSDSSHH